MSGKRTIGRLWQDAVAAGHPDPAYLYRHDDHWHGVSWAEAAERVDLHRPRPAGARRSQGGRVRDPRPHVGRVVSLRLRPGARRRGHRPGLRHRVGPRLCLRPRARRRDRRARRRRDAAREDRGGAGLDAGPPRGADVRGSRRARRGRPPSSKRASGRGHRGSCPDRRRRSLHLHLHVGHDRPTEGLHDPASQLLRDDRRDRSSSAVPRARRSLPPLPAAGAQLWPPRPPRRPLRRIHDRVRARPLCGR